MLESTRPLPLLLARRSGGSWHGQSWVVSSPLSTRNRASIGTISTLAQKTPTRPQTLTLMPANADICANRSEKLFLGPLPVVVTVTVLPCLPRRFHPATLTRHIRSKLPILFTLARSSGSSPSSLPSSPPSLSSSSSPSSTADPCSVKCQRRKAKFCVLGQARGPRQGKHEEKSSGTFSPSPGDAPCFPSIIIVWRGHSLVGERVGRHRERESASKKAQKGRQ